MFENNDGAATKKKIDKEMFLNRFFGVPNIYSGNACSTLDVSSSFPFPYLPYIVY